MVEHLTKENVIKTLLLERGERRIDVRRREKFLINTGSVNLKTISTLMEKTVIQEITSIIPMMKNVSHKATNISTISIENATLKTISTLMGKIVIPKTISTTPMKKNVNPHVVLSIIITMLLIVNLTANNSTTTLYITTEYVTQTIINTPTVKTATRKIIAIIVMKKDVSLFKITLFIISISTNMRNMCIQMEELLKKNMQVLMTKGSVKVSTKSIPNMTILTETLLIPKYHRKRKPERERAIKSISILMVIPLKKRLMNLRKVLARGEKVKLLTCLM